METIILLWYDIKNKQEERGLKFRYPKYYEKFQCIAGQCEDTCCAGWEIDIDDVSYDYYMSVEGEFGRRLRQSIREYGEDCEDEAV